MYKNPNKLEIPSKEEPLKEPNMEVEKGSLTDENMNISKSNSSNHLEVVDFALTR